jgi:CRISPR system Cascade subunit CasE
MGHVTVAQQQKWLTDRAERAGFSLQPDEQAAAHGAGEPTVTVTRRRTINFRRQQAEVTLRVVGYDGALTVTDREAFVATLTHGLGRAKGYGCGLLTIARPS